MADTGVKSRSDIVKLDREAQVIKAWHRINVGKGDLGDFFSVLETLIAAKRLHTCLRFLAQTKPATTGVGRHAMFAADALSRLGKSRWALIVGLRCDRDTPKGKALLSRLLAQAAWEPPVFVIAMALALDVDKTNLTAEEHQFIRLAKDAVRVWHLGLKHGWTFGSLSYLSKRWSALGVWELARGLFEFTNRVPGGFHCLARDPAGFNLSRRLVEAIEVTRSNWEPTATLKEVMSATRICHYAPMIDRHARLSGHGAGTHFTKDETGRWLAKFDGPYTLDHNHVDGIGLFHLLLSVSASWRVASHTFPKPGISNVDPAAYDDLHNALIEFDVRLTGSGWEHFGFAVVAQSITAGGFPHETILPVSCWRFDQIIPAAKLETDCWTELSFRFDDDPDNWSFLSGNRRKYFRFKRDRYMKGDLGDTLSRFDTSLPLVAVPLGEERGMEGLSLEVREVRIERSDPSLVRTHAIETRADDVSAALLFDGVSGDPKRMFAATPSKAGGHEITSRLNGTQSIGLVRVFQNPFRPTREISIETSEDGEHFQEVWKGVLPRGRVEWGEDRVIDVVLNPPIMATAAKFKLKDGWMPGPWGVDLIEVFGSPKSINNPISHPAPTDGRDLIISSVREIDRTIDAVTLAVRIHRVGSDATLSWSSKTDGGDIVSKGQQPCGCNPSPATFFARVPIETDTDVRKIAFTISDAAGREFGPVEFDIV